MVQCMLSVSKALGSIPSTKERKNQKDETRLCNLYSMRVILKDLVMVEEEAGRMNNKPTFIIFQ